jgi:hypothetical protein
MGVKWSITLNEEQNLKVYENSIVRRMFWPKREKWREAGT